MLFYIFNLFGVNLFSYITVRAGVAFFLGFVLSVFLIPKFIAWAKHKGASQPIYELAPQSHQKKSSTPTMGGVVFIGASIAASLVCIRADSVFGWLGIAALILFCALGFIDDKNKILGGANQAGLSARKKLFLQILISLFISFGLYFLAGLNGEFWLPFYKHPLFDMSLFAPFFWALVMVSASNAVNLTDGLDGLCTVPAAFGLITLGIFAYLSGNAIYSGYLLLPKLIGVGELAVVVAALIGALGGFLWYNCYPAQLFMGDSGSLAIGGFMGFLGVATKNEILLILIGLIFVAETLSVILQVGSFKFRKKRIFLMAPLHHHFEIKGWSENKIIVRFWIIALLANLIALTALKLR